MTHLLQVKDNAGLLRDSTTNSIININTSQYNNYIKLKKQKEIQQQKYSNLEEEVSALKNDIEEIKMLLRVLITESK